MKPLENVIEAAELSCMEAYKEFKRTEVMRIGDEEITPVNAAAMYGKLLQFCNGAVYDEAGAWHLVHDDKSDLLCEKIESLAGRPVIVYYQFRSDIERIMARVKGVVRLQGGDEIDKWNRGEIEVMLAHAASAGHGINLQDGGHHIIWFGLPWSLELYQQAVARLDRQGQKFPVINTHLITKGTVEELVYKRLVLKDLTQQDLIQSLKQCY